MDLEDLRRDHDEFTGKASDVARQLAFAGIALVWIFRSGEGREASLPAALLFPTVLLVSALAADLLQYFLGSVVLGFYVAARERQLGPLSKKQFENPAWLPWTADILWFVKCGLVIAAYLAIFFYIARLF